jgi:hypothetical protein
MTKNNKILCSVLAIVFSLLAVPVGFSLVSNIDMPFLYRFLCNFVFMMQFIFTGSIVIALFRKEKK